MAAMAQQVGRIPARVRLGALACALGTATTITTVAVVGSRGSGDAVGYAAERGLSTGLLVAAALVVLAASVVPWLRLGGRTTPATWLVAAAVAGQLPVWSGWSDLPASLRAAVLAATFLVPGAVAAAVARQGTLGVVALGAGGGGALLHVAAFDPFRELNCFELRTCLAADPILSGTAAESAMFVATGLGILAAIAALGRVVTSPAPVATRVAAGVAVAVAALVLVTGRSPVEVADTAVSSDLVLALVVAAVALVLGAEQLRIRRTRRAVDRLIGRLEAAEAGAATVLPDSSELAVDQRLALENAQLTARSRAALAQTRALQRQAQQRADDERERIERDLHDGAQQQLVSAAIQFGIASSATPTAAANSQAAAPGDVLGSARADALAALEALREIAHGPFPRALGDEGLLAALEDLCADHGARLEVSSPVPAPLEAQIGRAAYATVEALLARAAGRPVLVRLAGRDDQLIVAVDRVSAPLPVDVADRLESVAGTVNTGPGGTEVVLPCAW